MNASISHIASVFPAKVLLFLVIMVLVAEKKTKKQVFSCPISSLVLESYQLSSRPVVARTTVDGDTQYALAFFQIVEAGVDEAVAVVLA